MESARFWTFLWLCPENSYAEGHTWNEILVFPSLLYAEGHIGPFFF